MRCSVSGRRAYPKTKRKWISVLLYLIEKFRFESESQIQNSDMPGEIRSAGIGLPRDLVPNDFDWELSRPRKPWSIGPASVTEHYFSAFGTEKRQIASIKLFGADVTRVLCGGELAKKAFEKKPTAASETAATNALATYLKANADLTRASATTWLREEGFSVSGRGFQARVWPNARKAAGLDETAAPGRKRRKS